MRIPLRTVIGFGASATSMALVLLAGLTATREESVQQATSGCPAMAKESPLPAPATGAESPAGRQLAGEPCRAVFCALIAAQQDCLQSVELLDNVSPA